MINVKDAPVDIEEVRLWANGYREMHEPPLPWEKFSDQCGVPAGTLQPFCKGTYQGRSERIARKLFMFRQTVENRAHKQQAIPTDPGFFETETSVRIRTCLQIAHMGRITAVGTGPGTGKTITVQDYAERAAPVWIATMRPTTNRLNAMIKEVFKALGNEFRHQWVYDASNRIIDKLRNSSGLLVIDEANHLSLDAIEELRSWHDATGVGICLLGNEELLRRIESGRHQDQFARLNRRIAQKHVAQLPTKLDVEMFCDAWKLEDPAIRKYFEKIARNRTAGGLGECRMLIEAGSMLAANEERGLTLADLRDAQSMRATRWIDA